MLTTTRDRAALVARLRSCYVAGVLSHDTFEARVEATLKSTHRAQLSAVAADLPRRRSVLRDAVIDMFGRRVDCDAVRVPLPPLSGMTTTVGRSRGCDLRLVDDWVSARHLEIRALDRPGCWLLVDLGSLNGTWYLGRRVARVVVSAGDRILIGTSELVLAI